MSESIDDGSFRGRLSLRTNTITLVSSLFSAPFLLGLIASVILAVWCAWKIYLMHALEYTSDLLVHVQKARSYLYGYPLLYDNFYGPHPYHNTFTQLLFAPFTHLYGAIGLFVPTTLIYALSIYLIISLASRLEVERRWTLYVVSIVLILGPIGFWMFDDPVYGWHPEPLVFPLGIFFALSLVTRKRVVSILMAMLVALTHEGGPILAWSIQTMYELIVNRSRFFSARKAYLMRLGTILIFWALLFVIGVIVQRTWDPAGAGRFDQVINLIRQDYQAVLMGLLVILGRLALLLTACCFIGFFVGLQFKEMFITILCVLPLVAVGIFGSLAYSADLIGNFHNIFWPSRFAFVWGAVISGLIISVSSSTSFSPQPLLGLRLILLCVVSLPAQFYWLKEYRDYDLFERFERPFDEKSMAAKFRDDELALVECLGDSIPNRVPILVTAVLRGAFHSHFLIGGNKDNPYRSEPQIYICEFLVRDPYDRECQEQQLHSIEELGYRKREVYGIRVSYTRDARKLVKACMPGKKQGAAHN
ncbi:MAG: hypothetical protein KDD70_00040 [Bdellovibrionales bacterium]|nr:hypothetical protein [Bdellovibrionales bacterium]